MNIPQPGVRSAIATPVAAETRPPAYVGRHGLIRWLAPAALFAAALLAYWPALHGAMLWDDDAHVTRPALRSLAGLGQIWTEIGATQQYYPVLHSAFWCEHRLWGDHVLGYHATNLVLHVLAALLVVAILRRLAIPGAWLAGFVFALHPVAVESVAWISEQKNTLSAVFYLAAMYAYLRFDDTRRRGWYACSGGLFVAALLTKTVVATLPAALLVALWWRHGRLGWRRDVAPLVPWFAAAIPVGLFTGWVERTFIGAPELGLAWIDRVLLPVRILCFYLGKLLWPADLTFIYPRWDLPSERWTGALCVVTVVIVTAAAVWRARSRRGPLAGWLFFAGTLFPALGFFAVYPFVFSYVADHFQYLATLGLIVPLAAATVRFGANSLPRRTALAVAAIVPLGLLTWRQAGAYRDAGTLYRATLARNSASWLAHYNLGVLEETQPGGLHAAIAHYRAALRLNPEHWPAHNNLGSALLKVPGGWDEAIREFQAALRLRPDFAEAHNNLGIALRRAPERRIEAIAHLTLATRLDPAAIEPWVNLGNVLATVPGRLPDAVAAYRSALARAPDDADAHFGLGNAWTRTPGRLEDAIAEYRIVLRLRPEDVAARNNLALALARQPGRADEAEREFRAALARRPSDLELHRNLANLLLRVGGRLPDAIAEYQAALALAPNDAELHCSLGIALSDVRERHAEARRELEAAVRLKPGFAAAHYALAVVLLREGGSQDEAIGHLEAAVRADPGFAPAAKLLAELRR